MNQQFNNIAIIGLTVVIWVITCIAAFVGFDGYFSLVAIILLALFIYASTMLWRTVFNKRVAPLELMFWLFHTNFLLLPAFSQSVHRSFYWSSYENYLINNLLFACTIIVVGLLAFGFGSGLVRSREHGKRLCLIDKYFISRPLKPTWRLQVFLIIILVAIAGLVSSLGTEFFTSSRMSKLSQVNSLPELGLLLNLPRALSLGVLIFSIALLVQGWHQKKILIGTLMIFFMCLGLNLIVNFPLSVARFWIFGFFISLIWIVAPLSYVWWRSAFVIGMTAMQFTVFPLYSQITRGGGLIGFDVVSLRKYLHHADFDGFQSIVNITQYIQESGFEFGRNLFSVALFFVPRSVWVDKAEPLGVASSEFMGYVYTNLSAPIYAELYADFGFFSLALGMLFFGWAIRKSDNYFDHMVKIRRISSGVVIISVLSGYLIILLRGSLLGVVPSIATLIVLLLIASWLTKRNGRRYRIKYFYSQTEGIL